MTIVPEQSEETLILDYIATIEGLLKEVSSLNEENKALRYALARAEADKQELRDKIADR